MREVIERLGMGWIPDYPDFRDYTGEHEDVNKVIAPTGILKARVKIPVVVDLREWCSPIENQLSIGSCIAHAGVGDIKERGCSKLKS